MKKIGLVGASGRTGRYVVEALRAHPTCSLHSGIVSPRSARIGAAIEGTIARYSGDVRNLTGCDVVIDFSNPDVSVAAVEYCAAARIPIVVATTGHSIAQMARVQGCSERVAIGVTPNTSIGAAAMSSLLQHAKRLLGASFDIEVMEIHHRMKRDAPSGTAKSLISTISDDSRVVFGRDEPRQSGEVGVVSLRGGDVVGDHTVYFLGEGERLELTHQVTRREVFGVGAVRLAEALLTKPAGLYSVRELVE